MPTTTTSRITPAYRLPDLFRLTQAFDERRPQQERPRPHRILCGAAQLIVAAFAYRGVLFGKQALVADGLGLGVLDGHVATLALVAVENFLSLLAAQNFDQLFGQIEGVVDAAVHPHGADRAVHVGGVAGQDRAADTELLRH